MLVNLVEMNAHVVTLDPIDLSCGAKLELNLNSEVLVLKK